MGNNKQVLYENVAQQKTRGNLMFSDLVQLIDKLFYS